MKFIFLLVALSAHAGSIPVFNETGEIGSLTAQEYAKTLSAVQAGLQEKLITPLETSNDWTWKLEKISLGLGATGEIGIGPYQLGTSVKQRFVFTR
jgi:hypothetical protein